MSSFKVKASSFVPFYRPAAVDVENTEPGPHPPQAFFMSSSLLFWENDAVLWSHQQKEMLHLPDKVVFPLRDWIIFSWLMVNLHSSSLYTYVRTSHLNKSQGKIHCTMCLEPGTLYVPGPPKNPQYSYKYTWLCLKMNDSGQIHTLQGHSDYSVAIEHRTTPSTVRHKSI